MPESLVQRTPPVMLGTAPGSFNMVVPGNSGLGDGLAIFALAFHGMVSLPTETPSCSIQFLVTASVL